MVTPVRKVLTVSLVISTAYLGWTLIGQRIAEVRGVDFWLRAVLNRNVCLQDRRPSIPCFGGSSRLMGPTIITSMYRFWEMQRR